MDEEEKRQSAQQGQHLPPTRGSTTTPELSDATTEAGTVPGDTDADEGDDEEDEDLEHFQPTRVELDSRLQVVLGQAIQVI